MMSLTKITSALILLVYSMLTIIRIGVFYCGCTQSQQFVVVSAQSTCPPCSSSSEGCCQHNDHYGDKNAHEEEDEDDEEEACCSLAFQYVEIDQLKVNQPYIEQAREMTIFALPYANLISNVKERWLLTKIHSPPPNLLKIPVIYVYGQLRL